MSETESAPPPNLLCPQCRSPVGTQDTTCSTCGVDLALAAALAERVVLTSISGVPGSTATPDLILPRFGEFLLKSHYINETQLQDALTRQRELAAGGHKKTIGQVLLERGAVTREQLDQASIQQVEQLQSAVQGHSRALVQDREEQRQAAQKLSELNELKANFIGTIRHELRTPLSHIKGYQELLTRGVLGAMNDEQKRAVEVIAQATEKLNGLIDDLIRFASGAKSGMLLHETAASPNELLERVLEVSAPKAAEDHIALNAEIPPQLPPTFADWEQIYWVVFQLLDNAIKFTPDYGQIILKAEVRAERLRISLRDTGIGIPANRVEELFEPFHQLDGSSTRRYGGMGLGLALVKRIVEAHQSRIEVESQVGGGSIFSFELPLAKG